MKRLKVANEYYGEMRPTNTSSGENGTVDRDTFIKAMTEPHPKII